jgi:FAD/FMN-containing dehydrogenase
MAAEAPSQYRVTHLPGSDADGIHKDAPILAPLIAQLRDDLVLYTRSSPHFKDVSRVWNRNNVAKPLAVARCLSTSAVQSVVSFCSGAAAKARGSGSSIPLVVRSAGHDGFNRSTLQDGLMLDVRGLDSITISPDRQSATIGGGVIGGNLIGFLDDHGLITPTGYCNTVGYVGWATGGGYGVLAGAYGLGVDQILGATLVDAAGNLVDTDDDPNLLWAIRGAGTGNFGVVVSLRIRVYERSAFLGGLMLFPAAEAAKAMIGLKQVIAEMGFPDEFSGDCSLAHVSFLKDALSP